MKRRNFNLIKTGRKNKLALAVGLALAMSAMGSVYASGNDDTFKNFANKDALMKTAEGFKNHEFKNSTGLEAIGADKAYALGYSGDGVTLGIVDTGVRTDHEEFEGKVDLVNETVNDWTDKETWHGSHVAGIMVAKKSIGSFSEKNKNMMGVAFNANLKSIDHGVDGKNRLNLAKKHILTLSKDVKIINNSWNPVTETGGDSFIDFAKKDIKNNDRVYVFSAGNDGNIDVSREMTGKFANDANTKSNFINVVNIDDINNISVDSNIAKGAQKNTVCAIGVNVNSILANSLSDYTEMSGTSMSAPYVSGTLGLVQEANPYLTGNQLVDVVLTTANTNFEHPQFMITLKNHEEDNVKIIDTINLICIDYNNEKEQFNDLVDYFQNQNDDFWNIIGTHIIDLGLYRSYDDAINIADQLISENEIDMVFYDIEKLKSSVLYEQNIDVRNLVDKIDGLYGEKEYEKIKNDSSILLSLLKKILATDTANILLKSIEKNPERFKKYDYTFEEVYGQGVVDTGKAVQGLGAIDVDRLSQEDITTRYSNDKFYMYQVDTKKAEDNFKARNYSIWSNDISEKNVTDIHAGLEKTGSVGLILLGENTYTGPTVAKGGFLHIVRGVGGDVYALGNRGDSVEINGYAKNVYALKDCKVKIKDTVTKNYANVDKDFLTAALPDTNKVDINGGLFAIGKNSITGEGSTINANLTRSDSVIKGALYQDELGKINLSLANEAKFILQQGTGYYAGNSYKSNDTVNNLRMDSFATFDMSQDGVYSTLKIGNLTGNDGQFILGTDLLNQKGDNLSINKADNSEQWISILDKNGVYVDNENETKEVFIGSAPSTLWFKGYALAQDVGVNQYKFNPHIYFRVGSDYNTREWYFDGFNASVSKPEVDGVITSSGRYTTDNVLNNGLTGYDANIKVDKGSKDAMLIYGYKEKYLPTVVGVRGASFLGEGDIKIIVRNDRDITDSEYEDFYGDYTTGIEYNDAKTFKFNQNVSLDVKGKNLVYGLDNYCVGYSDRSSWFEFNKNLNINAENTNGYKVFGIANRYYIKGNGDTNINLINHDGGTSVGVNNQATIVLKGNLNISDCGSDGKVKFTAITNNVRNYDPLDVYFVVEKDVNINLTNKENVNELYYNKDFIDSIDIQDGTFKVGGKISIEGSVTDYSIRNKGIFTADDIKTNTGIKNEASMEVANNIEAEQVTNYAVLNVGNDMISNSVYTSNELNVGGKISASLFETSAANVKAKSIQAKNFELRQSVLDVPEISTDKYKAYSCDTDLELLNANDVEISGGSLNVKNLNINGKDNTIHLISYRDETTKLNVNEDGSGVVKIAGNIAASDYGGTGSAKVNLTNEQSYFNGELNGFSTDSEVNISNGALWKLESSYYTIVKDHKINLHDGGVMYVPLGNIHMFRSFSGDGGIIKFDIHQVEKGSGDIKYGIISIDKNDTEGAHHTIVLNPDTADFLLEEGTKINPLELIGDYSEKNGGYKINFTINPFDAGAYNYTPTLVNESIEGFNSWKVTDIKLTGSTPNPTPDPNPDPNPNPTPNPNPDPDPDPNPNPTPNPNPDPTPDPNPTPAPVLSNLTYNTRANAINNYYRWRDEYNNLQKRLGDLRMSKEENGLWARTFHGKEESGKYGLNNQYNAFQIGYDKQLLQDDGGKWFIGAAVTSYDGKTNYAKQGKADNNSIGLALYGSYLGEKGHYFDVVARHSRLKSELTSYAAGTGNKITGDYHNWGSSLSMEYGRRISMKHDFYLQPEAELTYGTTSSASYSLSDGSRVKQDGISSLNARAGLTVGKEFKNSNIFASISAVHDFGDDNVFSITDKYGKTYKDISNLKDSWYELSVGGNVKFNNNTYIYADLEKTFGGDIQTKWRYNFGVRYSF